MKRVFFVMIAVCLLIPASANCDKKDDWTASPVIEKAYEQSTEKLYLEWQGNAPVYQVFVDNESVASVATAHAVIPMKNGAHIVMVYPINEAKSADTKINVGLNIFKLEFDLAALGLDPKKLTSGNSSLPLNIDYTADPIFNAVPDKLIAQTDFNDRVLLSFTDRYNADEYLITVKNRNDVNYVRFNMDSEDAKPLISKANSIVTVTLDQEFLQKQGCMVPELNEKYSFTVQLRKYAVNVLNGEKEKAVIHDSKASGNYDYTLKAAWKAAPFITYASQTADGQITLKWDHDDNGLGCEYEVLKINKTLGIKTGEEVWGSTTENELVVQDLLNGGYTFAVRPRYQGEAGDVSEEVFVDVKNNWVEAPALSCGQIDKNQVRLSWPSSNNVETYHITIYYGDSDSLLRFIDLDYSKHSEFDLTAEDGVMEYVFNNEKEYNADAGLKIKFEIYGVRHAANGTEQKSATSTQTITIK